MADGDVITGLIAALLGGPRDVGGGVDTRAQGLMANLLSMSALPTVNTGYVNAEAKGGYYPDKRSITLAPDADPYTLLHEFLHHATETEYAGDPQIQQLARTAPRDPRTMNPANLLHDLIYGLAEPSGWRRLAEHRGNPRSGSSIQEDEFLAALIGNLVRSRHDSTLEALK